MAASEFRLPCRMVIHDDYYEHYGVEYIHIDEIYAGLSAASGTAPSSRWPPFRWRAGGVTSPGTNA